VPEVNLEIMSRPIFDVLPSDVGSQVKLRASAVRKLMRGELGEGGVVSARSIAPSTAEYSRRTTCLSMAQFNNPKETIYLQVYHFVNDNLSVFF
jgi:hypothetical protein